MIRTHALWVLAAAGAGTSAITALAATEAPKPTAPAAPAAVAPPVSDARALEFFESKIRPLLSEKCFGCHTGPKAQGQLDLRSRAAILKGGVLGTALKPGDPDGSLLVQVVRYQHSVKMPPQGKMPAEQIQLLEEWVRVGAPWPATPAPAAAKGPETRVLTPEEKIQLAARHWAFQPVRAVKPPKVKNAGWVKTPIDAFVAAELEKRGLKPNPYADRRTLIRRATFDLTGLPPTPEEIQAFVDDKSPTAWEKVIDRLLASPQYGERWGRHWLDVMRYSDSNGLDWNEVYAHAHRYRDYVIKSLNQDKSYDQFIREQIAGDLLPAASTEQSYEQITATGMLVMGPKLLAQQDRLKLTMDVIDEQIDVVSKGFMGVTVSCARCHDHKFDPIPTKDYYALAGIFKSTLTMNGTLTRNGRVWYWNERPLADPETVKTWKAHDTAVKVMQDRIKKCKDAEEKKTLTQDLKKLQEDPGPPAPPLAMAVQEGQMQNVRIHMRGNPKTLGDEVPRGLPAVLARQPQASITGPQSGRLELAQWIASPTHPLTGRVLVNRVWQGHFGTGIVGTPDNFGRLGELPTHPDLLDYLATVFTAAASQTRFASASLNSQRLTPNAGPQGLGWSLKKLHRLVMLSATYQMSSDPTAAMYAKDPDNRWLWRMSPRRLEAEAIRDAMLAVNNQLDPTPGGSLLSKNVGLAGNEVKVDFNSRRRSVYLPVIRGGVYDVLQAFDFPDPQVVNGRRAVTTVPSQALAMLNSPFVIEQSEKMAGLVANAPNLDDSQRVELAYQRALGRAPSLENRRTLQYLQDTMRALEATIPDPEKRRIEAWRTFCQALYASTEFRYVN